MMKRLLLAAMLLAMSVATQRANAEIIMPCNGAFYTDNIRISDKDFFEVFSAEYCFKVPFKAWFNFPCSSCHLRITMPRELELRYLEDENGEELIFVPGEDFNPKWNLCYGQLEEFVLNENGEYCRVYNLVIYNTDEQGVLWEPRTIVQPHYKMFSLGFHWDEYEGNNPSCKIGDIEITSYMINYSNVTQWCPFYDNDGIPTRGDCGDVNEDNEINIADVNAMVNILLNKDYSKLSLWGDINQDGSVDIIDLRMTVEAMYGFWLNGYWYTGHKIEEGHSTASVRYRHNWYDVDGDGNVTIGDVTRIIDSLLDGNTVEDQDVDGDGNVTIADVVSLIDYILVGQP